MNVHKCVHRTSRGMQLSGLVVLAKAPASVVWKLSLKLRGKSTGGAWVRTARESEASTPTTTPTSTKEPSRPEPG